MLECVVLKVGQININQELENITEFPTDHVRGSGCPDCRTGGLAKILLMNKNYIICVKDVTWEALGLGGDH